MSLSFPTSPTVGQIYQGWTWNGAAWDPNYGAKFVTSLNGQKGDVTGLPQLIQTQNVTNAVQCAFINLPLSTYKRYEIVFDGMVTFAANGYGVVQVSNNNGSTWDNAADYDFSCVYSSASSSTAVTGAAGALGSNAAYLMGQIDLSGIAAGGYTPASGSIEFVVGARWVGRSLCYVRTASGAFCLATGFENPILTNPNAIRLVSAAAGNITVNASLFGYPN